jgi:hypothetical protein
VLITTQEPVRLADALEGAIIRFEKPTDEQRLGILQAYHSGPVPAGFHGLCTPFETPYELSLAAACSGGDARTTTSAALFDSYVGRRCDQTEDATLVRGVLCSIATG